MSAQRRGHNLGLRKSPNKDSPNRFQELLESSLQDHGRHLVVPGRDDHLRQFTDLAQPGSEAPLPRTINYAENRSSRSRSLTPSDHNRTHLNLDNQNGDDNDNDNDDNDNEMTNPAPPLERHFETIYDPTSSKNVTVHLDFDLCIDLDDEMEEFNRLTRRGDFAAAELFFQNHLKAHITNPWIFVQYAEMLVEKGDYKSFHQLDPQPVFCEFRRSGVEFGNLGPLATLELNWALLNALALSHSQHELQPILDEVCQLQSLFPAPDSMGSTKVKIYSLAMRLMEFVKAGNGRAEFPTRLEDWGSWHKIYQELLAQGRIWDFRDLYLAAHQAFDSQDVREQFLGSSAPVDKIISDWTTTKMDESTQLALLDILSFIVLQGPRSPEDEPITNMCLQYATSTSESIMDECPQNMRTRSFLRWTLAQATRSLRKGSFSPAPFDYFDDFQGLVRWPMGVLLPYYIPVDQENPGWVPVDPLQTSLEPLRLVLKVARDLHDYETEAFCLGQIIMRSQEPKAILEELSWHQKDKQHDKEGYLATALSKYLLARDKIARARLVEELNGFGWWQNPSNLLTPVRACARDILLQALSPSTSKSLRPSIRVGRRYYDWLPSSFQGWIEEHLHSRTEIRSTPHISREPMVTIPSYRRKMAKASSASNPWSPNDYANDYMSPQVTKWPVASQRGLHPRPEQVGPKNDMRADGREKDEKRPKVRTLAERFILRPRSRSQDDYTINYRPEHIRWAGENKTKIRRRETPAENRLPRSPRVRIPKSVEGAKPKIDKSFENADLSGESESDNAVQEREARRMRRVTKMQEFYMRNQRQSQEQGRRENWNQDQEQEQGQEEERGRQRGRSRIRSFEREHPTDVILENSLTQNNAKGNQVLDWKPLEVEEIRDYHEVDVSPAEAASTPAMKDEHDEQLAEPENNEQKDGKQSQDKT